MKASIIIIVQRLNHFNQGVEIIATFEEYQDLEGPEATLEEFHDWASSQGLVVVTIVKPPQE